MSSSAYLAKQFGALNDKALSRGEPGGNEDAIAVERFDPHRARLEAFRRDMLLDDVLAAGIAYQRRSGDCKTGLFLIGGGEHGDELSGTEARDIALDRELNRD